MSGKPIISILRTSAGIFCFYVICAFSARSLSDWLPFFQATVVRRTRRIDFLDMARTELIGTTSVRRALNEEATLGRKGYTVGVQLGEGSYAQVYSCYDERRARKCAIKIVNRRKAPADFLQKFLPRELKLLKKVKHVNVIQLYEIFEFGSKVYIVMEIAGHGDLLDYVKLRRFLTEASARHFFQQLVLGIRYLHRLDIVHRDLKCENILLSDRNEIKITDFGFARETTKDNLINTFCGSAAYAAPEVLKGQAYKGQQYDAWSLGVILYIMVCGSMPFDDSNVKRMIRDQQDQRINFTKKKEVSKEFKECILAILHPNPEKRLTVSGMLVNSWVTQAMVPGENIPLVTANEQGNHQVIGGERSLQRQPETMSLGDGPPVPIEHNLVPPGDADATLTMSSRRRAAPGDEHDPSTSGESSNKFRRV